MTNQLSLFAFNDAFDTGPLIPYQNFNYAWQGCLIDFRINIPIIVSPALVTAMAADNQPFV